MIPATYDIELYAGDTYYGPLITLPDLSPFGGPADLTGATVTASLRRTVGTEESEDFTVTIVDASARTLRLTLTPTQTAALGFDSGVWDLQVSTAGGWKGTPLAGSVSVTAEVTS